MSAALAFALFGPQAATQVIGAVLIAHASYSEIYIASAAISLGIASWLARQHSATTHPH